MAHRRAGSLAPVAVDRFGIAIEPVRFAAQVRPQALPGRHAIPAAGDDLSHLDGAERGHHRIFGIVTPGKAFALRIAGGLQQQVEKILLGRAVRRQLAVGEEFRQRALRLGAVNAVDRVGLVIRDSEQALNAGEPRLRVVVVGFFRQIDGRALSVSRTAARR